MNKLIGKILRQRRAGIHVGGFKHVLIQTVFYISLINFGLIAVTAYTVMREHILVYLPWFKFWMFIVILGFMVLLAMILEFKFIYPSYMAFKNIQEYEHQNLLRKDLAEVLKGLSRIERKLGGGEVNDNENERK